jgi:cyclophilin family peptidyl-prolyl cis-trans isomerase
MAQTGDPTGTGAGPRVLQCLPLFRFSFCFVLFSPSGGESIYGEPFKDEYHSRLKFSKKGMVGSATANQDENTSQFFITLDRADHLTRKHTLFGKVRLPSLCLLSLSRSVCVSDGFPSSPCLFR